MQEAVIEKMVETSKQIGAGDLNPFQEKIGEVLPPNLGKTLSGFLVRIDAIPLKVNSEKLLARIVILRNQLLIAKFVGMKPPLQAMRMWLKTLNQELRGSTLTLSRSVGKGFFFLSGEDTYALHNALMLSPFKSEWGTCLIQSWIPGFSPDNPNNLAFPTWVSLRNLPYEHHDQALEIAKTWI